MFWFGFTMGKLRRDFWGAHAFSVLACASTRARTFSAADVSVDAKVRFDTMSKPARCKRALPRQPRISRGKGGSHCAADICLRHVSSGPRRLLAQVVEHLAGFAHEEHAFVFAVCETFHIDA